MRTLRRLQSRFLAGAVGLWVIAGCATHGAAGLEPVQDASYVYFASNVDQPLDGQAESLAAAAEALDADPWLRVVIVGHTDSDGDPKHNRDLAFRRAAAVRDQLEELSELDVTDRTRLAYYGEERPLADNETDQGKATNRRVQIYFFRPQKDEGDELHLRRVFGSNLEFAASAEFSAGSSQR